MSNYIHKVITITETFLKILAIRFFRALLAKEAMPKLTQEILHCYDQTVASRNIYLLSKNITVTQTFPMILRITI